MNSIHDMGGMDGFGPVEAEVDEPVFHEPWEGRVFGLFTGLLNPWNRGRNFPWFRFALESLPPSEYLRMSYYERWFEVVSSNLLRAGLVSTDELASGYRDPSQPLPVQLATPNAGGIAASTAEARFAVSDEVRVRNLHPRGHTRVPRYVRDKRGIVVTDNGVWALQDTDERGRRLVDFQPHVYTVRFEAQELWGERGVQHDGVYVDLWEKYIEPA